MSISAAGATRRLELSCADGEFTQVFARAVHTLRALGKANGLTGRREAGISSAAEGPAGAPVRSADNLSIAPDPLTAHHFDTTGANA
ncbi:hypothetical protein [Nocardia inohanensis]|uniref:hypothetical protein n=1 Tax=Nocardia inohanensis TaxID=209246 RepID=UPI00082C896A|nr:hypothetical protein [Nocardia inohanensis]